MCAALQAQRPHPIFGVFHHCLAHDWSYKVCKQYNRRPSFCGYKNDPFLGTKLSEHSNPAEGMGLSTSPLPPGRKRNSERNNLRHGGLASSQWTFPRYVPITFIVIRKFLPHAHSFALPAKHCTVAPTEESSIAVLNCVPVSRSFIWEGEAPGGIYSAWWRSLWESGIHLAISICKRIEIRHTTTMRWWTRSFSGCVPGREETLKMVFLIDEVD